MQIASSHFENQYTFAITGSLATQYDAVLPALEANAIEVIAYLSDFVKWDGTLDFVLHFDGPVAYGPDGIFEHPAGDGLLPSFGGTTGNQTWAQSEALSGVDTNGSTPDVGAYILPNIEGTLTNRGFALYIDLTPDAYERPAVPAGQHDFFSIYLHEVLHSLGIWSTAQPDGFGQTIF